MIDQILEYDPTKIYGFDYARQWQLGTNKTVAIIPWHKNVGASNEQIHYLQKPGRYYGVILAINTERFYTFVEESLSVFDGPEDEIMIKLGTDLALPRWQLKEMADILGRYQKREEPLYA